MKSQAHPIKQSAFKGSKGKGITGTEIAVLDDEDKLYMCKLAASFKESLEIRNLLEE